MTLEAIKEAVAGLPEDERHSLAAWLNELDYDEWDKQIVKDFSPGGRGMAWAERVKREIAEGKARPMEEGLAEAKAKPVIQSASPSGSSNLRRSLSFGSTSQHTYPRISGSVGQADCSFCRDPRHPSIQLKPVGKFSSTRITDAYRTLAVREDEVSSRWFWIALT